MAPSKKSRQETARSRESWKKRRQKHSVLSKTPKDADLFGDGTPVEYVATEALGLPALSGQIIELIDPLISQGAPLEKAAVIGVAAWNVSVTETSLQQQMIEDLLVALVPGLESYSDLSQREAPISMTPAMRSQIDDAIPFMVILRKLIERKNDLYPDDRRYIVRHWLEHTAGGYNLRIACSVPPDMMGNFDRN